MTPSQRTSRAVSRIRFILAPALAVAAISLAATASATNDAQPKPELKVEAFRSPMGARITLQGKNWPANARIKVTATRAPGTNKAQDFGMISADSTGEFKENATKQCTTDSQDDARENVTFTAADSATGVSTTARVDGSSWMCQ